MSLTWWVPLVAALIGGALVMCSNIILEVFKRSMEARTLALALRGEMDAIAEIVCIRMYVEHLSLAVDELKAGRPFVMPPIRIEREYFPTYSQNASRIGSLDPSVAGYVARAYTYANSFLEDATMPRDPTFTPDMEANVQETLDVLRLAVLHAKSAVALIEKIYMAEPAWRRAARKVGHWVRDKTKRHQD